MGTICCDFCGLFIPEKRLRYTVSIEVYAPYDILEIEEEDLEKDYEKDIRDCLNEMRSRDPQELESDVYKGFQFTICRKCQQEYIRDPLRFRPPDVH
jgi:hypothetical protein